MTRTGFNNRKLCTNFTREDGSAKVAAILVLIVVVIVVLTVLTGIVEFDWEKEERETDEFIYITAAAPETLDPAVAYDELSINIVNNLYERLVTYQSESSQNIVPMLASSNIAEDDETYIFHMRSDRKFSSGNIVTSEVVRYSIDRVLTMAQPPSWMLRQVLNSSGIIIDDFNFDGVDDVKFKLERPYSGFIHIMAFSVCSIVDMEIVESNGGVISGQKNAWVAHNSAGSGPYKVTNWDENSDILVLKQNSKYHMGFGGKKLETIKFKVQESETLRLKAIKGDDADMADIPLSLLDNLTEETSVRQVIRDTMSVVYLGFNTEEYPFNNIDVRKAFSFAFNYNAMMDDILENTYGDRIFGPIPDGVLGHESNLDSRFYFDPNLALQHFQDAGYTVREGMVEDFDPLTFYVASNGSVMGRIMYLLKENLASLGIDVDIQYMSISDYTAGVQRGDFPVFLAGWSADYADPDDFVYPLLHSESHELSIGNLARYDNESVDEMIEEAMEILSSSDRRVKYKEIQNAVNGDVPYLWLYQPKSVSVMKNDISGFNKHPILGTNFYDITIVA